MAKSWRPAKGWETMKPVNYPLHCLNADECVAQVYEAGADAILQYLLDCGIMSLEVLEALNKNGNNKRSVTKSLLGE